jgi:hypothetical protein
MCLPILESLMSAAHGAEELGLCSHGLACLCRRLGRYIGVCLGYGHIRTKFKSDPAGKKYNARPITLSHDGILTKGFLRLKRLKRGTLQMRFAVSCK